MNLQSSRSSTISDRKVIVATPTWIKDIQHIVGVKIKHAEFPNAVIMQSKRTKFSALVTHNHYSPYEPY
jgi:hypothetical protein